MEVIAMKTILSPVFRSIEANSYSYLTILIGKMGQNGFFAAGFRSWTDSYNIGKILDSFINSLYIRHNL